MPEESRYEEIKKKLKYKKPEDINLNIEEQPKKMISVYESNAQMFVDISEQKLAEFLEMLESFDDYKDMQIVQRARAVIDSFQPVMFNLLDEISYLQDLLGQIAGIKAKEEKKKETKKLAPEELSRDGIITLWEKGYSLSNISKQTSTPESTVYRILKKAGINTSRGNDETEEIVPETD